MESCQTYPTLREQHRGIHYKKTTSVNVKAYTDANWAGNVDHRKSRSGCVIMLANAPIIWFSKTQDSHALSSCESEFVALVETIKECMWLVNFFTELKVTFDIPIPIYIDNKSAQALAQDPVKHSNSKHIDLKFKFIAATFDKKSIAPIYIPTKENIADVFTKAIKPDTFRRVMNELISGCKN